MKFIIMQVIEISILRKIINEKISLQGYFTSLLANLSIGRAKEANLKESD